MLRGESEFNLLPPSSKERVSATQQFVLFESKVSTPNRKGELQHYTLVVIQDTWGMQSLLTPLVDTSEQATAMPIAKDTVRKLSTPVLHSIDLDTPKFTAEFVGLSHNTEDSPFMLRRYISSDTTSAVENLRVSFAATKPDSLGKNSVSIEKETELINIPIITMLKGIQELSLPNQPVSGRLQYILPLFTEKQELAKLVIVNEPYALSSEMSPNTAEMLVLIRLSGLMTNLLSALEQSGVTLPDVVLRQKTLAELKQEHRDKEIEISSNTHLSFWERFLVKRRELGPEPGTDLDEPYPEEWVRKTTFTLAELKELATIILKAHEQNVTDLNKIQKQDAPQQVIKESNPTTLSEIFSSAQYSAVAKARARLLGPNTITDEVLQNGKFHLIHPQTKPSSWEKITNKPICYCDFEYGFQYLDLTFEFFSSEMYSQYLKEIVLEDQDLEDVRLYIARSKDAGMAKVFSRMTWVIDWDPTLISSDDLVHTVSSTEAVVHGGHLSLSNPDYGKGEARVHFPVTGLIGIDEDEVWIDSAHGEVCILISDTTQETFKITSKKRKKSITIQLPNNKTTPRIVTYDDF